MLFTVVINDGDFIATFFLSQSQSIRIQCHYLRALSHLICRNCIGNCSHMMINTNSHACLSTAAAAVEILLKERTVPATRYSLAFYVANAMEE